MMLANMTTDDAPDDLRRLADAIESLPADEARREVALAVECAREYMTRRAALRTIAKGLLAERAAP